MFIDMLKYIFDKSKSNSFKGIVGSIIKLLTFLICISPIFIYFLLYKPDSFENFDITSILIFIYSCIWFLIVFFCSQAYACISLIIKKLITKNSESSKDEEYYFRTSFVITTVVQLILTILLLFTYDYKNSSNVFIEQLNIASIIDINIISVFLKIFIFMSLILWVLLFILSRNSKSKGTNQNTEKSNVKNIYDISLYQNKTNIIINIDFNDKDEYD